MLLIAYDIYGFDNGSRIKEICDYLSTYNYMVVLIDFFRGQFWPARKIFLFIKF